MLFMLTLHGAIMQQEKGKAITRCLRERTIGKSFHWLRATRHNNATLLSRGKVLDLFRHA